MQPPNNVVLHWKTKKLCIIPNGTVSWIMKRLYSSICQEKCRLVLRAFSIVVIDEPSKGLRVFFRCELTSIKLLEFSGKEEFSAIIWQKTVTKIAVSLYTCNRKVAGNVWVIMHNPHRAQWRGTLYSSQGAKSRSLCKRWVAQGSPQKVNVVLAHATGKPNRTKGDWISHHTIEKLDF